MERIVLWGILPTSRSGLLWWQVHLVPQEARTMRRTGVNQVLQEIF